MVTHRLFASYIYIFFTSHLNVLAPSLFFVGQLNVLAYLFFFLLLANSTCWPIFFFTGQLNVLACHDYSQMDLIGSCYSPSHMLGKYFLRC